MTILPKKLGIMKWIWKPSLFSGRTGLKIATTHLHQRYFILMNREH